MAPSQPSNQADAPGSSQTHLSRAMRLGSEPLPRTSELCPTELSLLICSHRWLESEHFIRLALIRPMCRRRTIAAYCQPPHPPTPTTRPMRSTAVLASDPNDGQLMAAFLGSKIIIMRLRQMRSESALCRRKPSRLAV